MARSGCPLVEESSRTSNQGLPIRNVGLLQPIPARYTLLQGQMPYLRKPLVEVVREEPESATSAPAHLHFADISPRPHGIQFRHPIHHEWADADFQRLWRFDELMNNNGPDGVARDGDDWSHPAHTESTIPPASETADFWRMEIPPPIRKAPQRLSFGNARADVRSIIELSRSYVESLRNDYELSETLNQQAGVEPVWTSELQKRWNEDLKALSMPEESVYVDTEGFGVKKWESTKHMHAQSSARKIWRNANGWKKRNTDIDQPLLKTPLIETSALTTTTPRGATTKVVAQVLTAPETISPMRVCARL